MTTLPEPLRHDGYLKKTALFLDETVPDADASALRLGLTLMRAGNRLQSDLDVRATRPHGMSWAAFRVLFTIASLGGMSPKQIARLSGTTPATISSVLTTLDRDGSIVKTADPNDARSIRVNLTDAGRERTTAMFTLVHERMGGWMDVYTPAEAAILVELLGRIVDRRSPV